MIRWFSVLLALSTSLAAAAPPAWVKSRGVVRFVVEGPLDDVVGETRQTNGLLNFAPETWSQGTGAIAVELSGIRTGIDQRDRDMRVEFLETSRFPRAVLTIDSIERPSALALTPGDRVEGDAVGSFELHGIRRAVRVPITMTLSDATHMKVTGRFEVPFADYSIQRPQRLFLKLGDTAIVTFDMGFEPRPETPADNAAVAAVVPTVATVQPATVPTRPKPPRKPKPALAFSFQFKGDDAPARGERLFHSATTGGEGNKMTCFHCHAKSDERAGLLQPDGHVRAATTLYNAGQRPKLWGGFAPTVGKAAAICQKQFMLGTGLTKAQEDDVTAFVNAISPDSAADVEPRTAWRSMEALLRDPTGGDAAKGKKLADRYCMTCHLDGRVGPVWTVGLYEPDWIVRRVRRLEGHQNKQMPNWTIARLTDSELRDIVTYLAGPSTARVFDRKKQ